MGPPRYAGRPTIHRGTAATFASHGDRDLAPLLAADGIGVQAGLWIAGVIAAYLAYEFVHLQIHSVTPGGPLLRALRRYHYYHHFADDHVCYGVTTPLWDVLFASQPGRGRLKRG